MSAEPVLEAKVRLLRRCQLQCKEECCSCAGKEDRLVLCAEPGVAAVLCATSNFLQFLPAITPPSTSHTAPVTQLAFSDNRKATTCATSVGVPMRPIG